MNEKAISSKAARSVRKTGKAAPQRERGRPVGDRTAQKTKLVKAAMSVIAEDGYRAASVRKVAMRAGFTTGAVSYYFDDKVSMIVAAAEHLFDEFDAMLRALRHSAGLGQGAERWLTWMADTELWMANAQLIAYAAREPRCAEVFSRRYAHYRDNYAAILEDWQRSGSVRADLPAAILADQLCAISDGWMQLLPVEPARFSPDRLPRLIEGLIQLMAPAPSATRG